jgi:Tol biopolymer transport system component/predicted Ser/Thr protein kinase
MGEVYKARDTRLNRVVAIKVSRENFSERFEREARAIAALNHRHICTLYDLGPNYLVMEFVEGVPLTGTLPLEKAIDYAGQILEALDHAHRRGIIHRDLKPANILVTKQGIKLLDFGLAKLKPAPLKETDETLTRALTKDGQILGTLQYMSPEQLQGKEADNRSDLFSFGCVLYEMLTGKRAFDGQSAASVIAAILERPSPSVAEVAPPALDRVLKRCLEKDPDQRWQNALDLKAALSWAMEQPPRVVAKTTSRRWWIATAAILVIAVAAGTAWVLRPAPEQPVLQMEINPPEGVAFGPVRVNNQFALSPDGRHIVFQATAAGKTQMLWLRAIDSNSAVALAGTEDGILPFWSPDSRWIGFSSPGKLQKVDVVAGGQPQVICEIQGRAGATWGSGGDIVFDQFGKPLQRVPASGGTPVPVFSPEAAKGGTGAPWFLPDGKHFLYRSLAGRSDIMLGSLDGKIHRLLVEGGIVGTYAPNPHGSGAILYNTRGQLLARPFDPKKGELTGQPAVLADAAATARLWSASATGLLAFRHYYGPPHQLAWFGRDGRSLGTLGDPGLLADPRISPDQKAIAVDRSSQQNSGDIWTFDLARNTWARFTFDSDDYSPTWSSDSKSIVYASRRGANVVVSDIAERPANGVGPETRIEVGANNGQVPKSMSHDGRWLVLEEQSALSSIIVLRSRQDPSKVIRIQDRQSERSASVSPDGKWLLYSSIPASRREVLVQSMPKEAGGPPGAAGKWQISTVGGSQPLWRADGKEIFFVAPDGMMIVTPVESGESFFRPGAPRPLFQTRLDTDPQGWEYDVTPDGQRFLLNQRLPDNAEAPITLIVNWPALFSKK